VSRRLSQVNRSHRLVRTMFETSPGRGEVVDVAGNADQFGSATGFGAADAGRFAHDALLPTGIELVEQCAGTFGGAGHDVACRLACLLRHTRAARRLCALRRWVGKMVLIAGRSCVVSGESLTPASGTGRIPPLTPTPAYKQGWQGFGSTAAAWVGRGWQGSCSVS
jgi:hypothetical protein